MPMRSFDVSHRGATSGIVSVETRLELKSLVEFVRKSSEHPPIAVLPGDNGGLIVQHVVKPAAIEYDVVVTEKLPSPVPIRDRVTTSVTPLDGGLFGRHARR